MDNVCDVTDNIYLSYHVSLQYIDMHSRRYILNQQKQEMKTYLYHVSSRPLALPWHVGQFSFHDQWLVGDMKRGVNVVLANKKEFIEKVHSGEVLKLHPTRIYMDPKYISTPQ